MSVKFVLQILALVASFTSSSAQIVNFTLSALEVAGSVVNAVECDDVTRAESQCALTPFSGTFVCRTFGSLLGYTYRRTVCTQNVLQGVTLGLTSDVCGFCPEEGSAPETCTCICAENKVLVRATMAFGAIKLNRCVTNGMSQHMTAWGNAVQCVPQSECGEGIEELYDDDA
jgi:hypothetical protein